MEKKILEQEKVLENDKKQMIVSASAGSGKTFVMIKYITKLVCEDDISVKDIVVLTFTKAAAGEMKERLLKSLRNFKKEGKEDFIIEQIDALPTANISTIHSFCEKTLKKYANLLGLNENFAVLDEKADKKLRNLAFENSFKTFHKQFEEEFLLLMEFYKNNPERIKEILFEIEEIANSVADKRQFIERNSQNAEEFFDKAMEYLFNQYQAELMQSLKNIEALHIPYYDEFEAAIRPLLQSKTLVEMSKWEVNLPDKPQARHVGQEAADKAGLEKEKTNKIIQNIKKLNLLDEDNLDFQRKGTLEKVVLSLFSAYQTEQDRLKAAKNALNFSDLERYMLELSSKENLFDGVKYVFIDEYQDTNKIQERIVKNVAKNCNFVAVGDVKQGIYGFRLASCEIFLKDVEDFSTDKTSAVNYLKSNFRSDQKVLDFVNDIFKVCMTKELTGVDYAESSMLHAENEFKQDGRPINIDMIVEDKTEKEKLPKVYSVKDAQSVVKNKDIKMLLDIENRIYDVMGTKIYEDETFRDCRYGDIAILSRKRTDLFNNLEIYLNQRGIPVNANSKNTLLDEVEVKVLLNVLKISLNMSDEIALLSVLISPFGGFSLEQIAEAKDDRSLSEIVKNDEKFADFVQKIDIFAKNCTIFGIKKALLNLFEDSMYFAYLNLKHNQARFIVDKFLNEIEQSGFNFDVPGLVNFFENVKIDVSADVGAEDDSITLTTIHNSKGLEYPIVFLIGCDQSLSKGRENHDVKINENFGFALKYYDVENNQEAVGVKMQAISHEKKNKDFVEEMMIFYVALTRAKNKLYLFGKYDEKFLGKTNIQSCDTYFDFIFYALKHFAKEVELKAKYEDDNLAINIVKEVEKRNFKQKQNLENSEFDEQDLKKIVSYLNFKYKYDDKINFKAKESVTELNHKNIENQLEKYSNDSFVFASASVDTGNAYHLALKLLNFDEMKDKNDLHNQLVEKSATIENSQLLDEDVLWGNIQIVKGLIGDGKVFKEKEFILKEKICNLIENSNLQDEIMIQGVVDLFIVKNDEIVLVDYKFSNSNSPVYLVQKYKEQIKLYKIALENYFKKPVKQAYLLSLKNANLIPVET